jgi:hypothetical protein
MKFFCPFWAPNSYLDFNAGPRICRNSTLFRSQKHQNMTQNEANLALLGPLWVSGPGKNNGPEIPQILVKSLEKKINKIIELLTIGKFGAKISTRFREILISPKKMLGKFCCNFEFSSFQWEGVVRSRIKSKEFNEKNNLFWINYFCRKSKSWFFFSSFDGDHLNKLLKQNWIKAN